MAQFVGTSNSGCVSSSRRRVVLPVCGRPAEEAGERRKSGRKSGKQEEAETPSAQTGSDDQGAKAGTRRSARSARGASPMYPPPPHMTYAIPAPAAAASKKAKH
jgi:hypothetical protein